MDKIDASIGDPIRPFSSAAKYAFECTMQVLNQYDNYGDYQKDKIIRKIHDFFKDEMKLVEPGWTSIGLGNFVITNGTTAGYSIILKALIKEFNEFNKQTEIDQKPVIIMPTPTYGLFYHQPQELGIEIIDLEREPDGSVDPNKLNKLLADIAKSGDKRVLAYYDSNPNNPTGHIRDAEETNALAEVFKKHQVILDGIRGKLHNKVGHLDSWLSNRIRIIDDMVYMGTEYGDKKPQTFAADEKLFKETFILAGVSKIGLASLRSGLVICGEGFARELRNEVQKECYFPSIPAMHALEARFSMKEEFVTAREEHFKAMNSEHKFSGNLMKALINGISSVEITPEEEERMVSIVSKELKLTNKAATKRLKDGISNVKVTTSPESGFFHMLDFSTLNGMFFNNAGTQHRQFSGAEKLDDNGFMYSFSSSRLSFCIGNNFQARATFAMPPEKIVQLVERIEYYLSWFAKTEKEASKSYPKGYSRSY